MHIIYVHAAVYVYIVLQFTSVCEVLLRNILEPSVSRVIPNKRVEVLWDGVCTLFSIFLSFMSAFIMEKSRDKSSDERAERL